MQVDKGQRAIVSMLVLVLNSVVVIVVVVAVVFRTMIQHVN